jgi:hypothetical protein
MGVRKRKKLGPPPTTIRLRSLFPAISLSLKKQPALEAHDATLEQLARTFINFPVTLNSRLRAAGNITCPMYNYNKIVWLSEASTLTEGRCGFYLENRSRCIRCYLKCVALTCRAMVRLSEGMLATGKFHVLSTRFTSPMKVAALTSYFTARLSCFFLNGCISWDTKTSETITKFSI